MPIKTMTLSNFEFVKAGEFEITDNPHPVKYRGKDEEIRVILNLVDDSFQNAEESAYIITVNAQPYYVGEYSYNLQDRWLRNGNYIWHHKDVQIEKELNDGNKVELWIAVNPYCNITESISINISKSIEQEILKNGMLEWNKRGQLQRWADWRRDNCAKVSEIIERISANKSRERTE